MRLVWVVKEHHSHGATTETAGGVTIGIVNGLIELMGAMPHSRKIECSMYQLCNHERHTDIQGEKNARSTRRWSYSN